MKLFDDADNVQRWVTRLDQVAVEYECRWGVNRLPRLVNPDLKNKWDSQVQKLNEAIKENDLQKVSGLVEGSIRGWKALEDNAIAAGHKPNKGDFWEVRHPESGEVFRIVKNNYDYDAAIGEGAYVFTLQEIARILDLHAKPVLEVKQFFPGAEVTNIKDENFNDDLPF